MNFSLEMLTDQTCSFQIDATKHQDVTFYCKWDEGSIGCSWKRRSEAISVSGRYRYLDRSIKEYRHNCSIAIRGVKEIDNGKWTCEEMVSDTNVKPQNYSRIRTCQMIVDTKRGTKQIRSNRMTNSPLDVSSVRTVQYQYFTSEMPTQQLNKSQDTNMSSNLKPGLLTFAGLFGALGLVVLIVCVIAIFKFIHNRYRRNKQQKYIELIYESQQTSSLGNKETRCSFINDLALNLQYDYIGVGYIKPSINDYSSTSINQPNWIEHSPETKHDGNVNTTLKREIVPLSLAPSLPS